MDNVTHTLTGLALARAGLNRWCPHAAALLMLAANAPDIDAITVAAGTVSYLEYHRGLTHSILFAPVLALLPVLVVNLCAGRRSTFLPSYAVSMAGVASHVLMDWTNVYGVRLFAPVSWEWMRLDITHVIDFWIWAVLLLALVGPLLSRLVSMEIGARASTGAGWSLFAVFFLLAYSGFRYLAHDRAVHEMDQRIYDGRRAERIAAFPSFTNPLAWVGLVDTGPSFLIFQIDLRQEFDPASGEQYFKPEKAPPLEILRKTEAFRVYLEFTQYPLWRMIPLDRPEGAVRVEALDLRFGLPSERRFIATAVLDGQSRVLHSSFTFGPFR